MKKGKVKVTQVGNYLELHIHQVNVATVFPSAIDKPYVQRHYGLLFESEKQAVEKVLAGMEC
jgi:hypothetical protein